MLYFELDKKMSKRATFVPKTRTIHISRIETKKIQKVVTHNCGVTRHLLYRKKHKDDVLYRCGICGLNIDDLYSLKRLVQIMCSTSMLNFSNKKEILWWCFGCYEGLMKTPVGFKEALIKNTYLIKAQDTVILETVFTDRRMPIYEAAMLYLKKMKIEMDYV